MILITGSLAFDHIMDFPGKFADHIMPEKIHILNVSFLVEKMRKSFGGTAGNIAFSLSLLGVKTAVMGVAGEDFGQYREFLNKNEVDTTYIKIVRDLYTSTAFGITDNKDNQIWGFYTGADSLTDRLSVSDVKGIIDFGIIAPNNPRAMVKFAGEYREKGVPFLFDPGMQLPWLSAADLSEAFNGAKIIIGNDYEIGLMEKKTGKKLSELSKSGKIVVTTLGDQGSRIAAEGTEIKIRPAKVKNVSDTAGAGDAYRAGLVAGYLHGFSLKTCGQMGSVSAAFTVEKFGTTTHLYTLEQFKRRYRENYGEDIEL